jgi:hypothetical protein
MPGAQSPGCHDVGAPNRQDAMMSGAQLPGCQDANPTAAAAGTPTAAAADFGAAGFSGAIFTSGDGSGPSAATDQAGSSSGSGFFSNNLSNFSFCHTPETVKKLFSKKEIPAEADATQSDAYIK